MTIYGNDLGEDYILYIQTARLNLPRLNVIIQWQLHYMKLMCLLELSIHSGHLFPRTCVNILIHSANSNSWNLLNLVNDVSFKCRSTTWWWRCYACRRKFHFSFQLIRSLSRLETFKGKNKFWTSAISQETLPSKLHYRDYYYHLVIIWHWSYYWHLIQFTPLLYCTTYHDTYLHQLWLAGCLADYS